MEQVHQLLEHYHEWTFLGFALCGLGYGLFQAPNDAITLLAAPHGRRSSASAMLAMCRSLGQTLGAMAAGSAFAALPGAPEGAFALACAFALAGCLALALRRACRLR